MSSKPDEPEKYSFDDIMVRLKSASSESSGDGELVTRPDGSQAVRIRKRKRRSHQPHKEVEIKQHQSRVIRVSIAVIFIFVASLTLGGAIIYYNSSPFRSKLVTNIAQASGANVILEQCRMNPTSANAGLLSFEWPDGNVLKNLTLRRLNAEIFISSFLGQSMNGEEVIVDDCALVLQIPTPNQAIRSNAPPAGESPFQFNRYRATHFNLTLGNSSTPAVRLSNSEASLYPSHTNDRPQLRVNQGKLSIAGWPKFRVDRALFEFSGNETEVISLRLLHESNDRGLIELSGTIAPYSPEKTSTLAVTLDSFELSGLTGPSLARLISGQIDSLPAEESNFLTFLPTANPSPVLEVNFRANSNSAIQIQGFPFLFALSQALKEEWFMHPIFTTNTFGTLHRKNGTVTLQDLSLENRNYMALRGEFSTSSNQTLSGNLQVGILDTLIAATANERLRAMFGPSEAGFRWITLKIGGQASAPTDNFKELFYSAVLAPQVTPVPSQNEGGSFEELTRPR
jgi:hypothetical protein